jgi:ribonuclease P protein component
MQPRSNEPSPVRIGFSVPKKRFRASVKRHRIRRLMAEAWRLNKQQLYAAIPSESQLHLFLIFTGAEIPPYAEVEAAVKKIIERLRELQKPADA